MYSHSFCLETLPATMNIVTHVTQNSGVESLYLKLNETYNIITSWCFFGDKFIDLVPGKDTSLGHMLHRKKQKK